MSGKDNFIRVGSNYLRLLLNFAIGLILVRLLLRYSVDKFSIYTLIVVGIGFGAMLKELARIAVVPSLSKTFKSDPDGFARSYSSSFLTTGLFGLSGAALMISLIFVLPYFSIKPADLKDAQLFLFFRALQAFLVVFLSPALNLMLIARRFAVANGLLIAERMIELLSIIWLIHWGSSAYFGGGLAQVGFVSLAGLIVLYGTFLGILMLRDKDFRPNPKAMSFADTKGTLKLFGWTVTLVLAMNLYLRFDIVFVNYFIGALATASFGLAVQATGIVQQVTNGLVGGLDSSFAHMQKNDVGGRTAAAAIARLSGLQASFGLAIAGIFIFCTHELILLWLGADALPPQTVQTTASVTMLMVLGIVARGFSEVWMNAMNGQGKVGRYAPWLLLGALTNPVLVCVGALFLLQDTPLIAVATAFLVLHIISYGLIVARIASRQLNIPLSNLYAPLAKPFMLFSMVAGVVWTCLSAIGSMDGIYKIILVGTLFSVGPIAALASLFRKRREGHV